MINSKKINVVDHYNWWLSEEFESRDTYKVKSGNKTILYIWHKNILINKKIIMLEDGLYQIRVAK